MCFKAIKKHSAVTQVEEQILDQIRKKILVPGSKLPSQRELASQFGVGRSSIREAVNVLAVKGYLDPVQGRGTYIKTGLPDLEERIDGLSAAVRSGSIHNLMEARMVLECRSASLAAERAGREDILRMGEMLSGLSCEKERYDLFLRADFRFHTALSEASGNRVICEMIQAVLSKFAECYSTLKTDQPCKTHKRDSLLTAVKVIEAVGDKQPQEAAVWMEKHLLLLEEELKEFH